MKNTITYITLFFMFSVGLLTACKHDVTEEGNQEGFVSGSVIDAVTRTALSDVIISVSDENSNPILTATTDSTGRFYITLTAGQTYDLSFTRSGHHASKYAGIDVRVNEEYVLEAVLQIDETISGVGSISGQITDALDGNPLNAALLRFRTGINVTTGPIVLETSTDFNGNFSVMDNLETGHYTAEISLQGYITNYFTVLVLGGQTIANNNATITPDLPLGETRIVLSWGLSPRDLDSHISGPIGDNASSRFHVYFGNKGSAISQPFTVLDVDDVASYGPETVTIKQQYQGLYRYSVHNFSAGFSSTSTALANSGAKVTVYQSGVNPRVFNVPVGTGTVWTVFELEGSTINPVNTISSSGINSVLQAVSAENDVELISSVEGK